MGFQFIFSAIYFFLPAYFTNVTPPIVRRLGFFKSLDKPLDFNKKTFGQPILGSHKTWRGIILGTIIGTLTAKFLFFLHDFFNFSFYQTIGFSQYREVNGYFFGFLMSLGAILGDLTFAFIKRRLKIEPGGRFLPFDQTNYVIFNALFIGPIFKINISVWIVLFILTFFLHIIANRLGYLLGINKSKW